MLDKEALESLTVDSIKEIDAETLLEKYDLDENDIKSFLRKGKASGGNYWTPNHDDNLSEEEVEKVKELFTEKFEDIEIKSKDRYQYTEFFLNTFEKHIFKYSVLEALFSEEEEQAEEI